MTSVAELRRRGSAMLSDAGCESGNLDIELLIGRVLGMRREQVIAYGERELTGAEEQQVTELLLRRVRREPIAYILGEKEFYGRSFFSGPAALVPRPETELLVERALARLEYLPPAEELLLFDVGTGSGIIVVTMLLEIKQRFEFRNVRAIASDISAAALEVARANAERHGVSSALELCVTDLLSGLPLHSGTFAMILANLPYVPSEDTLAPDVALYEPASALFGGASGLDVISRLVSQVNAEKPCSRGALLLEFGCGQKLELESMLSRVGLTAEFHLGLQGIPRVAEVLYREARC